MLLFQTEFGKIEINVEQTEAYFFTDDILCPIQKDGNYLKFEGLYGNSFLVILPIYGMKSDQALLMIQRWNEISRATV